MPDFSLVPKESATFRTRAWEDPATPSLPSRVTTIQDRDRFAWTANVGTFVAVWVQPDGGTAGGPDVDFAGRLPYSWFLETPYGPDSPNFAPGLSSQLWFIPLYIGHYVLAVRRNLGGCVLLHIDVIDPSGPPAP